MSKNKKKSYIETTKEDTDGNGDFDSINTKTYIYNQKAFLISEESRYTSTLYDRVDHTVDYYEYNKKGQQIKKTHYWDSDSDGTLEFHSVTAYKYNKKGYLIKETIESPDRSEDGKPDYQYVIEYNYDNKGNLTSTYKSYYYDAELFPYEYRSEKYEYDKKGNLINHVVDDPVFYDYIVSWTYEYDKKGRLLSVTHHDEFDYGPDGSGVISSYTYDKDGRILTEMQAGQYYNDVYNSKLVYTYSYDGKGNVDKKVLEVYREGDGPVTGTTVFDYDYGKKGELKQLLESKDVDADGDIDSQNLYKYFHDKSGTLVSEIRDYGKDGVIDYEYTRSLIDPGAQLSEFYPLV